MEDDHGSSVDDPPPPPAAAAKKSGLGGWRAVRFILGKINNLINYQI